LVEKKCEEVPKNGVGGKKEKREQKKSQLRGQWGAAVKRPGSRVGGSKRKKRGVAKKKQGDKPEHKAGNNLMSWIRPRGGRKMGTKPLGCAREKKKKKGVGKKIKTRTNHPNGRPKNRRPRGRELGGWGRREEGKKILNAPVVEGGGKHKKYPHGKKKICIGDHREQKFNMRWSPPGLDRGLVR